MAPAEAPDTLALNQPGQANVRSLSCAVARARVVAARRNRSRTLPNNKAKRAPMLACSTDACYLLACCQPTHDLTWPGLFVL